MYKDNVKDADIVGTLRPLLARYAAERAEGERFGDWCAAQRLGPVMDTLSALENQSIYVLREAYGKLDRLAMLWSIGKDSTVCCGSRGRRSSGTFPFRSFTSTPRSRSRA